MSIEKLQHAIAKGANKYPRLYIMQDFGTYEAYEPILLKDPAPIIGLGYVWGDEYKISLPAKVETFNDAFLVCVAPLVFLVKISIIKNHKSAKIPAYEPKKTPLPNKKSY